VRVLGGVILFNLRVLLYMAVPFKFGTAPGTVKFDLTCRSRVKPGVAAADQSSRSVRLPGPLSASLYTSFYSVELT
jgi:hypothetical protein